MPLPRETLAALLRPSLPSGLRFLTYGRTLDGLTAPTLVLSLDEVVPSPQPQAWHRYQFSLKLIVPQAEFAEADENLEALLVEVLLALEATALPAWTSATRVVVDETWHGYSITFTADFDRN